MPRAEQPLGGQTALFLVKPAPPSQVRDDDVEFAAHCPELLLTAHHACQVPDPSPGHYNDGDSSRFIGIEQNADVIANLYVGGLYCNFGFEKIGPFRKRHGLDLSGMRFHLQGLGEDIASNHFCDARRSTVHWRRKQRSAEKNEDKGDKGN